MSRLSQSIALAQRGGATAASSESGRSAASNLDLNAVGQYSRNQGLLADNLLRW